MSVILKLVWSTMNSEEAQTPERRNALNEGKAKLGEMIKAGKTDGKQKTVLDKEKKTTTVYRTFKDADAAREFIDFIVTFSEKYNYILLNSSIIKQ